MAKARLFDFRDARIYFDAYGISPETHFDRLRRDIGSPAAVDILDANMIKAWKRIMEKEKKEKEADAWLPVSPSECPF